MSNRFGTTGLAVALGMGLVVAWSARGPVGAQEKQAAALTRWEYKVVLPDSLNDPRGNQAQFDRLGADGWELVAVHSSTAPNYCVFKRPAR